MIVESASPEARTFSENAILEDRREAERLDLLEPMVPTPAPEMADFLESELDCKSVKPLVADLAVVCDAFEACEILLWVPAPEICDASEPTDASDSGGADSRDTSDLWDITCDADACCDANLRDETFGAWEILLWVPAPDICEACEPTDARDSGGVDSRDTSDLWDITCDADACCDANLRDETFEAWEILLWVPAPEICDASEPTDVGDSGGADSRDAADLWDIACDAADLWDITCDAADLWDIACDAADIWGI